MTEYTPSQPLTDEEIESFYDTCLAVSADHITRSPDVSGMSMYEFGFDPDDERLKDLRPYFLPAPAWSIRKSEQFILECTVYHRDYHLTDNPELTEIEIVHLIEGDEDEEIEYEERWAQEHRSLSVQRDRATGALLIKQADDLTIPQDFNAADYQQYDLEASDEPKDADPGLVRVVRALLGKLTLQDQLYVED